MNTKMLVFLGVIAVFGSGCQMYGDTQIKPHNHTLVQAVSVHKVATTTVAKPGFPHSHPANGYSQVQHHSHPGGEKAHQHNYGKSAPKSKPQVFVVNVLTTHEHHQHDGD